MEETTKQGKGPKTVQASTKAPAASNAPQKPAAYRPPHAKAALAVQAEAQLFGLNPSGEMSKAALKNKKMREKQKEKKAAEAAGGS